MTTGKIKHIHTGFGDKSLDTLVDEINVMLQMQHDDASAATAGSEVER